MSNPDYVPLPREVLDMGVLDMGDGTACVAVDQELIDRAKARGELLNEKVRRTEALVDNMRSKGAEWYDCVAVLIDMNAKLFPPEQINETYCHLIVSRVFRE